MTKKKIAIIGTGIAGMACGYFLGRKHDITFYEKESRPGGHTNTILVHENGVTVPVDTGFIVYNETTYPQLTRFFKELEIPTQETSMSFSVQHTPTGLEYCGTGLSGLFAQRRNLFSVSYIRMLGEINRFNRECLEVLADSKYVVYSIRDYLREKGYGADMADKYLIPMSSAIWSTEPGLMLNFPVITLVRFFKNHGLLGLSGHLLWRSVKGGSHIYRDKVLASFNHQLKLSSPAKKVTVSGEYVWVTDAMGEAAKFNTVVLACHADEALSIVHNPTEAERNILRRFRYQKNTAKLHTDVSVMPRNKRAWSSWNYRISGGLKGPVSTTVYWMNLLQKLSAGKNYFVSINDPGLVNPAHVLWEGVYDHPVFDIQAIEAQADLGRLNKEGMIYYCGSYFRYGFHEDAFVSALEVCRKIMGDGFWPSNPASMNAA